VQKECVIGVDFGGTNVRACAYFQDGSPAGEKFKNSSQAKAGVNLTLNAVAEVILQAMESAAATNDAKTVGVGIALPGHIENSTGLVRWAPNLGHEDENGQFIYWKDVQVRNPIQAKVGVPVQLGNDANLAALGEYHYGSGNGAANCLVMLTLGTGLGGGVVMGSNSLLGNAKGPLVLLGGNQGGAELGHVSILHGGLDCSAGTYGTLESYTQKDGISQRAVHRLKRGRESRPIRGTNLPLKFLKKWANGLAWESATTSTSSRPMWSRLAVRLLRQAKC
jgi:glucokinase